MLGSWTSRLERSAWPCLSRPECQVRSVGSIHGTVFLSCPRHCPKVPGPVLSKLMVLVLMVPPPEGLLFLCLSCLPGYEDYSAPKYKGTERETWGAGTSGIEQPSFHSSLGCPE